jgi:hypothetical protein
MPRYRCVMPVFSDEEARALLVFLREHRDRDDGPLIVAATGRLLSAMEDERLIGRRRDDVVDERFEPLDGVPQIVRDW